MVYTRVHMYLYPWQRFFLPHSVDNFQKFIYGMKKYGVKYLNFNHYTEEDRSLRFTVRFESKDKKAKEKGEEIAGDLIKKNFIKNYKIDEEKIADNIKAAHEFASMCVVELVKNAEFVEEYQKRTFPFTLYFIKLVLEKMGFELYVHWDKIKPYTNRKDLHNRVDKFTENCMNYAPTKEDIITNPDFLERFIHLFLNCALLQIGDFEPRVWKALLFSNTLSAISKTYKKS